MTLNIAIIGAGMAGLTCAQQLANHGLAQHIHVYEKSRGVGRLATRYQDDFQFDFGAPYFRIKSAEFRDFLSPFMAQEIIQAWHPRIAQVTEKTLQPLDSQYPYYISTPKMTRLGRALAQNIQSNPNHKIFYKTRVAAITKKLTQNSKDNKTNTNWQLFDEQQNLLGEYDWVICAAPLEQARDLLPDVFAHKQQLQHCKTDACYTLMLGLSVDNIPNSLKNILTNYDILTFQDAQNPLATLVCDSGKSINRIKPLVKSNTDCQTDECLSLTLFSKNAWASQHVDDDKAEVTEKMLMAFADGIFTESLGLSDMATFVTHTDIHRWRYANVSQTIHHLTPLPHDYLMDNVNQLVAIGDWCAFGSVEGAWCSGDGAAQALNDLTL